MIFKTIQSSVDSSKQSLALFNKDWNTYKSNFINASGGFKEKATTIFNSNDVNCLKEYNTQIQAGIRPSEAYKATMMNCTKEAKQNAVAIAKGTMTYEQATSSMKSMTLSAKAGELALKGLRMAGNMVAGMLIGMAVSAFVGWIDDMVHVDERVQEALEESVSKFEATTEEVNKLEDELKTCRDRLAELQALADKGTISVAEEKELETLTKTNDELERKLALKQAEQIRDQKEVLSKAKKTSDKKVMNEYAVTNEDGETGSFRVYKDEELIDQYKNYKEVLKLQKKYSNHDYSDRLNGLQDRIEEMYDDISPTIEAYEGLIDAGYELEGEDKTRYESLKKAQSAYLEYTYILNGNKEAYEALNAEQKRSVLLDRLKEKGLKKKNRNAVIDSLSDDDLNNLWDSDFDFTPPQMKDYESAVEYGKACLFCFLSIYAICNYIVSKNYRFHSFVVHHKYNLLLSASFQNCLYP